MTPRLAAWLRRVLAADTRAGRVIGHVALVLAPLSAALASAKLIWLTLSGTATKVAAMSGAVTVISGATRLARWSIIEALGRWRGRPDTTSPTPSTQEQPMSVKSIVAAVVAGVLHPATVAVASLITLGIGIADTAFVTHTVSAANITQLAAGLAGLLLAMIVDVVRRPKVRAELARAEKAAKSIAADVAKYDPEWRAQVDDFGRYLLTHDAAVDSDLAAIRALATAHGVTTADVLAALAEIGQSKTVKEITTAASAVAPVPAAA